MRKTFIAVMSLYPLIASAGFEVKEMNLNGPGYTDNLSVVPADTVRESTKHSLSYDPEEIDLNHQYKASKHVIDRMELADQAKIYAFINNAKIEKELAPNTVPVGNVTLRNIVVKSPYDTSNISNRDELDLFLRHAATQKLGDMVHFKFDHKSGNHLRFKVSNFTDRKISKIRANIVVRDAANSRVIMDQNFTETAVWAKPGQTVGVSLNMPSRFEGWKDLKDGLNYSITVHEVVFTDGVIFNAEKFYKEINTPKEVLDPHPFTEI